MNIIFIYRYGLTFFSPKGGCFVSDFYMDLTWSGFGLIRRLWQLRYRCSIESGELNKCQMPLGVQKCNGKFIQQTVESILLYSILLDRHDNSNTVSCFMWNIQPFNNYYANALCTYVSPLSVE